MSIYALGDMHLSFLQEGKIGKPMDGFGSHWRNHYAQIEQNWRACVQKEDIVLLPGDFSWAMHLEETKYDFAFLHALPGKKILVRGNHDYWWQSLKKMRSFLPPNTEILQNNCICTKQWAICGTRGWLNPENKSFLSEDLHIYKRELQRLELSLQEGQKSGRPILCMLHYPPFGDRGEESGFVQLLLQYGVKKCIYGHFHGPGELASPQNKMLDYLLVSCDQNRFCPQWIAQD